ncbi:histidine-type phosphatase [Acetobacter orleanensis]|nr:histidine-type phosphatase [Acetobacter orleanensis]PCD78968.1 histidine-type phosphatase [Acetobacter orleanensis]
MLRVRFFYYLILALSAAVPVAATSAKANPTPSRQPPSGAMLEKVVLVSRHGIRSPTKPLSTLEKTTGRVWSAWPVPPGELTDHGRTNLTLMGQFLRDWYAPLLPAASQTCTSSSAVFVWADATDSRTRQSGDILAKTLSHGCTSAAHGLSAGQHDPLFNALAAGKAHLDQQRVMPALTLAFQQDVPAVSTEAKAESALQAAFAPNGCQQQNGPCFSAPTTLSWKKGQPHDAGGLSLSASTAENLFLEYVEGLPSTVFAHTPTSKECSHAETRELLDTVLPAHALQSDRLRRLPAIAIPRGYVLAETLIESLAGQPVFLPDQSLLPPSARLTMLAGHDTTLDMLATLFGLDWSFADQPDRTAPDTTLAFELWRLPDGQKDVRFRIFHQSLEQLRQAQPMTAQTLPLPLHSQLCPSSALAVCSPERLAHSVQKLTEQFL